MKISSFSQVFFYYDEINRFIHSKIGKVAGKDTHGIDRLFDVTIYKVFITLVENYQIDFKTSGNFAGLLDFDLKILTSSGHGIKFPNIINSIDSLYIRCSLLSHSIISGKRSDVRYTFATNTMIYGVKLIQKYFLKVHFG